LSTNEPLPSFQEVGPAVLSNHKALVRTVNRGDFFKPCPGTTRDYLCCGYRILTPFTGCGMYCSYCILQAYFDHRCQVLYENFGDLQQEVNRKLSAWRGVIRIGTGEFADSLYQEDNLGLCKKISDLLGPYPNVIVEFKTKSDSIAGLRKIATPQKTVIGFSMNTPAMIALHEQETASLDRRLGMLAKCEEMGFYLGIHFDPIFYYPQWEKDYRDVIGRIFDHVKNPDKIAWWSMGGFRTNPALKKFLKQTNRHLPLFSQSDMVLGEDGKFRYFRPIRTDFYSALQEEINRFAPLTTLYLCMESKDVWEEAGMISRIPDGLIGYLDKRAEEILGIKEKTLNTPH
jgi:spore photoproduct lyase